ncbi:DUF6470 family protein [Paenibacillus beijingensis]|uniref:Uncharacterized protein n=1 Tax=Paenibacillus beijingensis TaxID=1126833 RepID=A0A0D5NHA0_9BACL|nr:DUF6470 family protein [Paenibacillus beijingensis]AJY74515.1 hypothetical protein VN24_07925 [Paenibacillus beijingensis]
MKLPQLQIYQQPAKLGFRTEWGKVSIHQQQAEQQFHTVPTQVDITSSQPVVVIDQSLTWDAINGGKPEAFIQRIYSQTGEYMKRHTIDINHKWQRIADLSTKHNPIPDLAREELGRERPALPVYGPASVMNTKFDPQVRKPEIKVTPGYIEKDVQTHPVDIRFTPGKVHFYMEQYPSVTIVPPPVVDLRG